MKKILIFGMFLLCLTVESEFESKIGRLKSSSFGNSLLQTIFIQIQTEDPLAYLIQMMQNLQAQLEAEQQRDDDRQLVTQAQCEADQESLKKIIGQATGISLSLKSELDQLNPQKSSSVANFKRKEIELEDLKKILGEQTERRQKEYSEYETIIGDLEQALHGVQTVKTYFDNYFDELAKNRKQFNRPPPQGSFLQFRDDEFSEDDIERRLDVPRGLSFTEISNKINKVKHQVKLEGYRTLVQILAQMTSQMKQIQDEASEAELLTQKILAVLKQIGGFIQKQRQQEEAAEAQRAQAFEELTAIYNQQIIDATSEKVAIEGMIELLSSKITQASNEKFEVDLKIQVKTSERSDRDAECLTSQQEYDTETEKRNAEKSSLALALDLITSKLGQLKKELLENGGF